MGRTTAPTGSHIGKLRVKAYCILRKLRIRCVICEREFHAQDLHKLGLSFVNVQYMSKILSPMCAIYVLDLHKIVLLSPMRNICTRFVQDCTSLLNGQCTLFFIRNSFIRNLYWGGQIAKKLSVLKPQRLKNFQFFFHFQYHNFEDTVTNLIKTCSEKNLFAVQTYTVK